MNTVRAKFPDCIEIHMGSEKELNTTHDFELVDLTEKDRPQDEEEWDDGKESLGEHVRETLMGSSDVAHAVGEYLHIPHEEVNLIQFTSLCDEQGRQQLTLTVGTNYDGVVSGENREKLRELFEIDAEKHPLMWHLDPCIWFWLPCGQCYSLSVLVPVRRLIVWSEPPAEALDNATYKPVLIGDLSDE